MNQSVEAVQENSDSSDSRRTVTAVVLDSDAGERDSDGGAAGVAAKMGGNTSIGGVCSSWTSRQPSPFLSKIYNMLANDETNSVVSWNSTGTSLVIWNHHLFAAKVLPIYFKHCNIQSFVSQLNFYGFKKIRWSENLVGNNRISSSEQWEFVHEYFRKGERHLLKYIKRRNQHANRTVIQPANETQASVVDASSCDKEFKILMKEHELLKIEIIKLKERQEIMQKKAAHLKSQALSNEQKHQKIIMLEAKIISWKQRNTHADEGETAQKIMKGKRKLEEKKILAITQSNRSTMCSELGSYACSSARQGQDTVATNFPVLSAKQFIRQAKIPMDEEGMGNGDSDTFIPLEDLIGKPFDISWVDYIHENLINHLKS